MTPGCFMEKLAAGEHTGPQFELCAVMWVDLEVKPLMETYASCPTNTLGINEERGRKYKEKFIPQLDLTSTDQKLLSLTDLVSSLSLKPNYDVYRVARKKKEHKDKKRSVSRMSLF
jgi:hypothetical protein